MAEKEEIKTLEPEQALALWRKGKDDWNAWVMEHPVYNISFEGVDFTNERIKTSKPISFDGYIFPSGEVLFSNVLFGDGSVTFRRTQFGKGDVDFSYSRFRKGYVNFNQAEFSDGDIYFIETVFGGRFVSFISTKFGNGNVTFTHTNFAKGDLNFKNAQFGKGNIDFVYSTISDGSLYFAPAKIKSENISFEHSVINGNLIFDSSDIENKVNNKLSVNFDIIDFSYMTITGYLSLGTFSTNSVIDLSYTKFDHTLQLDKPVIGYNKENIYSGFWPLRYKKAANADDSRCFRLLKKYAEESKDHERKLDFFANEMRSDYGYGLKGAKLYPYLIYDKVSDYGRSFTRPGIGLLINTLIFTFIYLSVSLTQSIHKTSVFFSIDTMDAAQSIWGHALVLAAAHTVPFSFGSRAASEGAITYLFQGVGPINIILMHGLTILQGVISTIFLFLIGLALRNFFRS